MSSRLDPYALVGATFRDRYALEGFVGIGRFSAVYRGAQAETLRPMAIRLLKVRTSLSPSQRVAVLRRLGTLGAAIQDISVRCPTVAGVLDVGAIETPEGRWMPGLVHPWLTGDTLEAVLEADQRRRVRQRTLAQALDWMTPLADALSCAHASGLVHGSLAPRNVVVRGETSVELLDLGVAPALAELDWREGAFGAPDEGPLSFFVPAYASAEHFAALSVRRGLSALGPPSDVFSLALLMVELLTGRAPLGDGDDAQLEAASRDPMVRPTPRARGRDLGGPVEAIFERALAVRAADRYATVESFWSALRTASRLTLRARGSIAPPPLPDAEPPDLPHAATLPGALVTRAAIPRSSPPLLPMRPNCLSLGEAAPGHSPMREPSKPARCEVEGPSGRPLPPSLRAPMKSEHAVEDGADDLVVGSIIAEKYRVERLLGRGGMGAVWLCTHLGLGERVAVKLMCRKMAADPDVRTRFEREARASARIKSRYVTRVYDTGELPDLRPYIVMEYMEGETLAQTLLKAQTISLADTVRIIGQVGRGLARAHELGIVHRDIKPDNVFLAHTADDGIVAKVFDFGIVKVSDAPNDGATREGVLLGTPHYMSPEQASGLAIDQRSDIYSLGVLAFRMLTGKRPFQGDSVLAILVKICGDPLPSLVEHAPTIPASVDAWFRRACARDRTRRFASVIECADALASAAGIAGLERLRDVSLLPPPPSLPAAPPHESSCPTLLDEVSDVLEEETDEELPWPLVSRAETPDVRLPYRTNPLFGGEPSLVSEDSVAPQALDPARVAFPSRRPGVRLRGKRAAIAALFLGLSLLAVAISPGLLRSASSHATKSAASSGPPPEPLPSAPPANVLGNLAPTGHANPPIPVSSDAGPAAPQSPPHAGRSRRAASAASR